MLILITLNLQREEGNDINKEKSVVPCQGSQSQLQDLPVATSDWRAPATILGSLIYLLLFVAYIYASKKVNVISTCFYRS